MINDNGNTNKRRVVITGLGVVAPNGIGKDKFWENLIAGKSYTRKITRFDASNHPSQVAAEIDNFNPKDFIDYQQIKRSDLSTHYAMAASKLALSDANLNIKNEDPERIGIVMGIAVGGIDFTEKQFELYKTTGMKGISPYTAIAIFPCALLGQLSIQLDVKGYSNVVSTGCTSGTMAIINSYHEIKNGLSDVIITGGAEAPISPVNIYSFCLIKAISKRNHEPEKASRPFDKQRDGFVIGEGSGIVILEELNHALIRKAHIYAEVIGAGITTNAYHMTAPEPNPIQFARAIKMAIESANIKNEEIDYINAHGSSTRLNEISETLGIKKVFGDYAYKIPVSSIKSMIGHALGAAGSFQTISNCLAIENNMIPPTINYEVPDSECDLDCVPNQARKKVLNIVMHNSAGFSGVNATLILKKFL